MDPRDQTFMTIHNLAPDANILFASESVFDILGYTTDEVQGKSAFDYFHPDEVPFARSVHSRGVLLDKAAVLHYARIMAKDGRWVNCECCFTIVHDVLVASTSIYQHGEKSSRRALEAPQIRRLFSSSPRDPRYHMLEHLSPKFKMPPMEREPRAALILNRFTRNLSIMFATNAVATILGLQPDEIKDKPFYECIQENCLQDAMECLESAKANESIAYLRFWYRDPRTGETEDDEDEEDEEQPCQTRMELDSEMQYETKTEQDDDAGVHVKIEEDDGPMMEAPLAPMVSSPREPSPRRRQRVARREQTESFELEAVVSCTSDGLVVVLRKARPPIPLAHPPLPPPFNFENGLFAAPWGQRPIEPYFPPELLYTFRPPLLPQFMPLRESVKAAGGPPLDQLMRSIRDVAVFAWALTGINGNLAHYGHGLPGGGAQPPDGLPVWDRAVTTGNENLSGQAWDSVDRKGKGSGPSGLPFGTLRTGYNPYSPMEAMPQTYGHSYQRPPPVSTSGSYTNSNSLKQPSRWARPLYGSGEGPGRLPNPPQHHYGHIQNPSQSSPQTAPTNGRHLQGINNRCPHDLWAESSCSRSHSPSNRSTATQSSSLRENSSHLRYGWP